MFSTVNFSKSGLRSCFLAQRWDAISMEIPLRNEKALTAAELPVEPTRQSGKERSPTVSGADYGTQVPEGVDSRPKSPLPEHERLRR